MIGAICLGIAGIAWTAVAAPQAAQSAPRFQDGFTDAELKAFAALEPIDVHTHVLKTDPVFAAMLERLHLHIVDILVADTNDTPSHRTFGELRRDAWQFVRSSHGHAVLSTAFDPFDWNSPGFPASSIQSLNQDFARGAVGATIWSNVGMIMKDASGSPALPDDPKLEAVYKDMAAKNKTLFAHLSGADEAWGVNAAAGAAPGSKGDAAGDLPVPPFLQARDHILQMNPPLRVIGAHLGSVKEGLAQIGRRLDEYPNLAIDTSSRVDSLMAMPREQVRAFLLKYQDRILYGTDSSFRQADNAGAVVARWQSRYAVDWRFFATGDTFEYRRREVQGLDLPATVLRKLYHDNAVRWIPGVAQ